MQKTATLNLRIDPEVKQSAESVLSQLGLSMSTAVDLFLRQVALTGGVPFRIALPEAPVSVDSTLMTDAELRDKIVSGLGEIDAGQGMTLADALEKISAEG
jgi:addiction module RelB/DinJ family antitoxin